MVAAAAATRYGLLKQIWAEEAVLSCTLLRQAGPWTALLMLIVLQYSIHEAASNIARELDIP